MFPNNYSYNPGVVLDPVTMTPMITHGGNITVNPLGVPMRPQQKVWQKMFIKNIPQECTNELIIKFLKEFGNVKNFKRAVNNRGQLLSFCHFDLETGEQILRIKRLFQNVKLLDSTLEIKFSNETENFLKEWHNMQKDEWKKKLQAPGMNEAKQFQSIEVYHTREDKKYKRAIEDTLKHVNNQVKKLAAEKMREEERKEHPKEKERDRAKKKLLEDLDRNFHQKQQHWLKRQRQKEKQHRKEREREREREKAKMKRADKQINMEDQQLERRITKFLTEERKRLIEKQEMEDEEILMEENPPLPEQQMQDFNIRKIKPIYEEEIMIGQHAKVDDKVLVEAPQKEEENTTKELKRHEMFEGYEKELQEEPKKVEIELNLPDVEEKEQDKQRQEKIKELQTKVPKTKQELWSYPIDWDKLAKSVVLEKNIRPWLESQSSYYMGTVEEKFIALVEKKLFSRSHPDKIIKIMKALIDDDSEEFVIKLWKTLVLQTLKLEVGLV